MVLGHELEHHARGILADAQHADDVLVWGNISHQFCL